MDGSQFTLLLLSSSSSLDAAPIDPECEGDVTVSMMVEDQLGVDGFESSSL